MWWWCGSNVRIHAALLHGTRRHHGLPLVITGLVPVIHLFATHPLHPHPEEQTQSASRRRIQCSLEPPSRRIAHAILLRMKAEGGERLEDVDGRHRAGHDVVGVIPGGRRPGRGSTIRRSAMDPLPLRWLRHLRPGMTLPSFRKGVAVAKAFIDQHGECRSRQALQLSHNPRRATAMTGASTCPFRH
jgi:hypothetical protein